MGKKLKVLMSSYACEPNRGSEPEVGWQWAMQMSLVHDVTVLTRTNNREVIEKELESLRGTRPVPEFIYHDEGRLLLWVKRHFRAVRFYYILWQISAWKIISRLNQERRFDLMHHVTFAGFRYRTAIWEHGVPTIWGPVGGIQFIPWRLLPWKYPVPLLREVFRHINNFVQSAPFHALPSRGQMTTITLVSTGEMEEVFLRLGLETTLMPTIGLNVANMTPPPRTLTAGPLKVLFAGSVITLKGIDLAIHAVAEAKTNATFTIVGEGKFLAVAKKMARELGIESKVEFRGKVSREEMLKTYSEFDLFLLPSLHDTGSYATIEAMVCRLPVICLDCGGPRIAVKDGAGIRVPLGTRRAVVQGLAEALRRYHGDRQLLLAHGKAAREVVLQNYDWDQKGRQMDAIYQNALALDEEAAKAKKSLKQSLRGIVRRLFPIRELTVTAMFLMVIGAAGFLSVERLKENAQLIVDDTLPGLSDADTANSSLAEAFNRSLLMLMAEKPEECAAYRKEMDAFNKQTSASLDAYARYPFTPEERKLYDLLLNQRQKYLATREQAMDLIEQQKRDEAMAVCRNSLLPAYLDYKSTAEQLLKLNAEQGHARSQTILRVCTVTEWVVAGAGILLFAVGFLIGLFK